MPDYKRRNRSLLIFYFLVGYVLLQFGWWAYHIISLAQEVSTEEDFVRRKVFMISGEAIVFFAILLMGVYFVRKSFKKELDLAKEKKNFALSVTHELKTPIASSKLFTETLLNRNVSEEKRKDILQKILKDQTRLQELVENILLASQIDGNKLTINKEKVQGKLFIASIIDEFQSENEVKYNIPDTIELFVDRFYFTSVIQNLHENAVKYSQQEGKITWEMIDDGNTTRIRVMDEGIGIPPDKRQKIFELFHRIGDENTRNTKGTGVGLYIVQKIVELHNGTIRINENKPKGSIFEIILPK